MQQVITWAFVWLARRDCAVKLQPGSVRTAVNISLCGHRDKLFLHHNSKYTCGYERACQSRSSPNHGSQVNNTADPCISKWQLTVCGHCGLFWQIRWLVFLFHPLTCYLGMAQCAAFVCSTAINACSYSNAYTRQLPDRWCWSGSRGLSKGSSKDYEEDSVHVPSKDGLAYGWRSKKCQVTFFLAFVETSQSLPYNSLTLL